MPTRNPPAEPMPIGETITAIRPLPSDPSMRSVRIGRRVIARLRADDIESIGLHAGQTLTDDPEKVPGTISSIGEA